ncbi:GNAT family N-acetyltransferase [Ottowia sp.]|uniref:GNAT family N-acetyltransferase n=1 Tax=Ottowia sp. TaxID=1898956 RepID=UPI0039E28BC7
MRLGISSARPKSGKLAGLFPQVGRGHPGHDLLRWSIDACTAPFAPARGGESVGCVSVFSDGVPSTLFGEVVLHPGWHGRGAGRSLLAEVERLFPAAPIHVKALGDARGFFKTVGFRSRTRRVCFINNSCRRFPGKRCGHFFLKTRSVCPDPPRGRFLMARGFTGAWRAQSALCAPMRDGWLP